MGVKGDALWEVQWHPGGSGRIRRLVLTRRGLRRAVGALAVALVVVLAVVAALPLGLRGFLTSFTVEAAQRENRDLRAKGDALREEENRLAAALRGRVQRGRRVAWVLGVPSEVWRSPCTPPPRAGAGDTAVDRWLVEQGERLDVLGESLASPRVASPAPLAGLPLASPLDQERAVPTALFGWRLSPFTGKTAPHYGITLAASLGEPVRAPGAGRVLFAGSVRERQANEWTRFGNLIVVDHGGGVMTVFAHLRDVTVQRGQAVARGQRLGSVGQTGWTRVPALYYEVRWSLPGGASPIDPGLVTPMLPVEDLDARLADPTGGLPPGFARIDHLLGARSERTPRARVPFQGPVTNRAGAGDARPD